MLIWCDANDGLVCRVCGGHRWRLRGRDWAPLVSDGVWLHVFVPATHKYEDERVWGEKERKREREKKRKREKGWGSESQTVDFFFPSHSSESSVSHRPDWNYARNAQNNRPTSARSTIRRPIWSAHTYRHRHTYTLAHAYIQIHPHLHIHIENQAVCIPLFYSALCMSCVFTLLPSGSCCVRV